MKKLLNTLYVTTQGAWLARERENVLVQIRQETRLRLPVHTLGAIVGFGQVSASAPLMGLCAERGVALVFLTERGRFLARVEGPVSGNVLLRREQYRRADDGRTTAGLAAVLVATKIANSRAVLQRALRDRPQHHAETLQAAVDHLATLQRAALRSEQALDVVRGTEGAAAKVYFSVFDHLITRDDPAFRFAGRNRRPPLDAVNALLSFLYTLLCSDVAAALNGVGLDPAVGYLHRDRPGRPGLALDLMEELRPFVADRLALSLINRRQLDSNDFQRTESGAVTLRDDARRRVLVAYQERKRDTLRHPFLDEDVEIGLIPHIQAQLLARHLRGDHDAYPAFVWR